MNLNGWGVPQGMLMTESEDLEVPEESWKGGQGQQCSFVWGPLNLHGKCLEGFQLHSTSPTSRHNLFPVNPGLISYLDSSLWQKMCCIHPIPLYFHLFSFLFPSFFFCQPPGQMSECVQDTQLPVPKPLSQAVRRGQPRRWWPCNKELLESASIQPACGCQPLKYSVKHPVSKFINVELT